jgi:hypothetical protein
MLKSREARLRSSAVAVVVVASCVAAVLSGAMATAERVRPAVLAFSLPLA